MNNNLIVPNTGPWPVQQYGTEADGAGQRTYSSANILDFQTLLRIILHWRWLILGAVALGLVAAIILTLLTTPVYRSLVTLEANPPSVAVSDEQTREQDTSRMYDPDFVATQVGLLKSLSVAQRTAQDLNLANNPEVVAQDQGASQRLQAATAV